MVEIVKRHLPQNCYSKFDMKSIDGAVIHFISAKNILPEDPFNLDVIFGIFKKYKVSAKYLIRRDGTVIELVPGNHKAYHAGYSRMNGRDSCNDFTTGIELEGGTNFPYTNEQILNLAELLAQSMTENGYTLDWVRGHDRVRADWIAKYPEKAKEKKVPIKVDPGENFPWEILQDMLFNVSRAVERGF